MDVMVVVSGSHVHCSIVNLAACGKHLRIAFLYIILQELQSAV